MGSIRKGSHTVHDLTVHLVFSTKYRYHVLKGDVQIRCRDIIRQVCDVLDIQILKGVVSKDHVHLHISYPSKLSVSDIMRRLKGRTSKKLQEEFPDLRKRYWGRHFWSIGYGAWSTGNLTEEMVEEYLNHHGREPNGSDKFILE
ncbi:MAG: IS200/IS605 family transposase [Cyclobacteriaceae bacterium]